MSTCCKEDEDAGVHFFPPLATAPSLFVQPLSIVLKALPPLRLRWGEGRREEARADLALAHTPHTHWPSGREKLLSLILAVILISQAQLPTVPSPLITVRKDNVQGKYFYGS